MQFSWENQVAFSLARKVLIEIPFILLLKWKGFRLIALCPPAASEQMFESLTFLFMKFNNGDSAISEVEVILDYSHSLFELEGSRIEELGTIPPSIPRTAKFILKPLGCVHNEEIRATVRYRDRKWEKYIATKYNMQGNNLHQKDRMREVRFERTNSYKTRL